VGKFKVHKIDFEDFRMAKKSRLFLVNIQTWYSFVWGFALSLILNAVIVNY